MFAVLFQLLPAEVLVREEVIFDIRAFLAHLPAILPLDLEVGPVLSICDLHYLLLQLNHKNPKVDVC